MSAEICIHFTHTVIRLKGCTACKGKRQIKIFACPLQGECTFGKKLKGITCCNTCDKKVLNAPICT